MKTLVRTISLWQLPVGIELPLYTLTYHLVDLSFCRTVVFRPVFFSVGIGILACAVGLLGDTSGAGAHSDLNSVNLSACILIRAYT